MSETDALEALKDILSAMTVPTGAAALSGVYVWPDDYDDMPDMLPTPAIIVAKQVGVGSAGEIKRKAHGLQIHEWAADILVFCSEASSHIMDETSAESESSAKGWALALAAALWENQTLNQTVAGIGESGGDLFRLFRYAEGHIPFGTRQYWGVVAKMSVRQSAMLQMRA